MKLHDLKQTWIDRLSKGDKLTVRWDAGGDECLVTVFSNNEAINWQEDDDNDPTYSLIDLIIAKLDLPNAGVYFVEGGGELFAQNGQLLLTHESQHSGLNEEDIFDDEDPENYDYEQHSIDEKVNETVVLIP